MMASLTEPLRLTPTFKHAPWGGQKLATFFADCPAGTVGEAWVCGDFAGYSSALADGGTLGEAIARDPAAFYGSQAGQFDGFPLLLKFLDAREALSVQVHPDDRQAQALANFPRGKTEAWLVLDAEPTARVEMGFRPGVSQTEARAALEAGRIAECLHSIHPQAGDCYFVPAGLVHAAHGGVLLFEVQQACDVTYRLHDWHRVDAHGEPRALHVEEAFACIDFALGPGDPVRSDGERLIDCPYFALHRRTAGPVGTAERFTVIVGLSGRGELRRADRVWSVDPGDCLLLPAACGACELVGAAVVAECFVPMEQS